MQNALDVWRDGEVEKAFEVYRNGSSGSIFGYGSIEAKDFESVWDNMKGASRQLCIERIATENDARRMCDMPPLTPKEEDFYRNKVKEELKSEFDRRIELQGKIDAEKKNLDLIFEELDKGDMLDSSKVWYRGFGGPNETPESRMARMEHLIQRKYKDLDVSEVYNGPQNTEELNGRISAAAMAETIRGYFAANTQAEAEEFLQDYYKRFKRPLENADLAGNYIVTCTGTNVKDTIHSPIGEQNNCVIVPTEGNSGIITFGNQTTTYTLADDTLLFTVGDSNISGHYTFVFSNDTRPLSGTATCNVSFQGQAFDIYYTFEKVD